MKQNLFQFTVPGVPKNYLKCAIDWLLPKYRTRLNMIRQFLCMQSTIATMQTTLKSKQNSELKIECQPMPKLRTFDAFKDFENQPSYLI